MENRKKDIRIFAYAVWRARPMMFVEDVPMEEIQVTWMVNRIKNKLERRQASPRQKNGILYGILLPIP
jgi:hypothetical protein